MTERAENGADTRSAHQQLLKMLHKGFLEPDEFAEAEILLKQLLRSPDKQTPP